MMMMIGSNQYGERRFVNIIIGLSFFLFLSPHLYVSLSFDGSIYFHSSINCILSNRMIETD